MYYVKNNSLFNDNRIEIKRTEIDKNMIMFLNSEFKKVNANKCIYLSYNVLELDFVGYDGFIEKYYIVCNSYNDLNNLKEDFDKYK